MGLGHRERSGAGMSYYWTRREDEVAKKMKSDGATNSDIGERLGKTPAAVKRRLYWIGLSPEQRRLVSRTRKRSDRGGSVSRLPKEVRETILHTYLADREAGNDLAKRYGLSPVYAQKLAAARGETPRRGEV